MTTKILVPFSIIHQAKEPIARTHLCRATYLKKIMGSGILPLPVSPLISEELLAAALKEVSGILLMGGEDVHPSNYQAEQHPKTDPIDPDRDAFEIRLVRKALELRLPLLGICRGIQVMAVATGGALIQHVPDLGLSEEHGLSEGMSYEHICSSKGHEVLIEQDSRIARILKRTKIHTNSAHHQAVAKCGQEFRISGRSPQGVTEIMEHRDENFFAFGVQSHPEAETGDLEPLLTEFFQHVREFPVND